MNVVVRKAEQEKTEKSYPKLMLAVTTGAVVLCMNDRTGILLSPEDHTSYAELADWSGCRFIPFTGEIVLSND